MKRHLIFGLVLINLAFLSCQKAPDSEQNKPLKYEDKTKSFLKDVKSDDSSKYYISGEFDNYPIYCSSTFENYYPDNATVLNAYYFNNIGLDNIHVVRQDHLQNIFIALYFSNTKMYNRTFPYNLPHPNLDLCESVQMELINRKKLGTTAQNAPNDDFSFQAHSNTGLKVTVNSLKDDIIEGVFSGNLKTNTGSIITAKNGKFRVRLKRIDMSPKQG